MATLIELYNEAKICKQRFEVLLNDDTTHTTTDPYWDQLKDASRRRDHAISELRHAMNTRTIMTHSAYSGDPVMITIAEALPRLVDADDSMFGDMARLAGFINPQISEG